MRLQETLRKRMAYHLDKTRSTQQSLARSIGVSPQQMSMFLSGKRFLSMERVLRACQVMGINIGELEGESRARKPEVLSFYQARLEEVYDRDELGFDLLAGAIDAIFARATKKLA